VVCKGCKKEKFCPSSVLRPSFGPGPGDAVSSLHWIGVLNHNQGDGSSLIDIVKKERKPIVESCLPKAKAWGLPKRVLAAGESL
jgi:hypothetical protein